MFSKPVSRALMAAALLLSATAGAHEGYTTRQANVRAGPDTAYPVVAVVGAGYPVEVVGCVTDYLWCDVIFGDNRGWVSSRTLQYVYQSRRVPLYEYGATLGLPILGFSLSNYWDDHYRSRSFYSDRPRWQNAPHANWNDREYRERNWNDRGPRDNNWRDRGQRDNDYRNGQPRQAQPQYIPQRPEPQYRQQPQYGQPEFNRQRGQNQAQPQPQPQVQQQQAQSVPVQPQVRPQQRPQQQPLRVGPTPGGGYVPPQAIQPDVTGGN